VTTQLEHTLNITVIESIDVEAFRVPLPDGPWGDQIHHVEDIEVVLVTVHGANGLVGTGFSHTSGYGASTIAALAREIAPILIERDLSPRGLWQRMWHYVHDIGGAGVTTHAISAFDIAHWDLLGKSLGAPVVDLIGRVRQTIPLYGSGINLHKDVEEVIEQVQRWKRAGYSMGKVKVGKPDLEEDVERLAKIRSAVPDFPLAVDANQGWDYPSALRAFSRFEQFDLLWVEEPLPSDDIPGHERLRGHVNIPVGLGENVYNLSQFAQYFTAGAVDFVQADVGRVGGITGYLDISTLARSYNLPMTPHFVMELSASLLCAIPNGRFAESTDGGTFVELGILRSAGVEEAGSYRPSEAPGTGLVYNREYLESHALDV
jgi:L-alanine-DL-glutamate epimerase-like enolase superfamily enzyme